MQLSKFTDYAFRSLIYLAKNTDENATVDKLAENLEVSTDYLLGITDIRNYKTLHNDVNKNVESFYENTKEMLKQDGLMLYGKPATKDDIDNILKAMKVGMMMALQKDND